VAALIADQLMAAMAGTLHMSSTVTKTLTVRSPPTSACLCRSRLEAYGEAVDNGVAAHGTIFAGGVVCVDVEAELVTVRRRSRERSHTSPDVAG
jgi:hypothetical protein